MQKYCMKGIPTKVVWALPRHPKNKKPRTCGVYMFRRYFCFSLVSWSGRLGYNVGLDLGFFRYWIGLKFQDIGSWFFMDLGWNLSCFRFVCDAPAALTM